MGKFTDLENDIFSIFGSAAWISENIKTFPQNYIATNVGQEFLRVQIIPNGWGLNLTSVSGILVIDIFVSAGEGPSRASTIADKLDSYLVGKSFSTGTGLTQLFNSSLQTVGEDVDDKTLYRSNYTITFSHNGVS